MLKIKNHYISLKDIRDVHIYYETFGFGTYYLQIFYKDDYCIKIECNSEEECKGYAEFISKKVEEYELKKANLVEKVG